MKMGDKKSRHSSQHRVFRAVHQGLRLLTLFIFLSLGTPSFGSEIGESERNALKYGRAASNDWGDYKELVKVFRQDAEQSKSSLNTFREASVNCRGFFTVNERADDKLVQLLLRLQFEGPGHLVKVPTYSHYAWARVETFIAYFHHQLVLVENQMEGGQIMTSDGERLRESCAIEDREKWGGLQRRKILALITIRNMLWPFQGVGNAFELSGWLAQKMVDREKSAAAKRFIAGSLVGIAAVYFWPAALAGAGKLASVVGLKATVGKTVLTAGVSGLLIFQGYEATEAWLSELRIPENFAEDSGAATAEESAQDVGVDFSESFRQFVNSRIDDPWLYHEFIFEKETHQLQLTYQELGITPQK